MVFIRNGASHENVTFGVNDLAFDPEGVKGLIFTQYYCLQPWDPGRNYGSKVTWLLCIK